MYLPSIIRLSSGQSAVGQTRDRNSSPTSGFKSIFSLLDFSFARLVVNRELVGSTVS